MIFYEPFITSDGKDFIEAEGSHVYTKTANIETLPAEITVPAITQKHVLNINSIEVIPNIESPTIAGVHILKGKSFSFGSSIIEIPILKQKHILNINNNITSFPIIIFPSIHQIHNCISVNTLETQIPFITIPTLRGIHILSSVPTVTEIPIIDLPIAIIHVIFTGIDVITKIPVISPIRIFIVGAQDTPTNRIAYIFSDIRSVSIPLEINNIIIL